MHIGNEEIALVSPSGPAEDGPHSESENDFDLHPLGQAHIETEVRVSTGVPGFR